MPLVRMMNKPGSNGIQMCVLYPLPEHLFVPEQTYVRMPLPDGVFRTVSSLIDLKFTERIRMTIFFQVIDNTTTADAFRKP